MKKFIVLVVLIFPLNRALSQETTTIFSYDKVEPAAEVVRSFPLDSVTHFEKIVLQGFGSKVPFYHFQNKRTPQKKYAILLHGLGGDKTQWIYPSMPYFQYTTNLTAIKDSLLTRGFSLVLIDAKFHGERSYELNFRDPSYLPPMRSKNSEDTELLYDMMVSTVKEVRLMMDYLEMVYMDEPIDFNLIGYSLGGALSLHLNSVDERVTSVVASVPPLGRPYTELAGLDWAPDYEEKMKSLSPLYSAQDQKSPVALLMGRTDFFIPESEAQDFYDSITIDQKMLKFYESGHELPNEYVQDVLSWISRHN